MPSVPALKYSTLSSFSWDQDNEKVKVRTNDAFFFLIIISLSRLLDNDIRSHLDSHDRTLICLALINKKIIILVAFL